MPLTVFSEDQIELLRKNPFTSSVTQRKLLFTKEFKDIFWKEYQEGGIPRNILEKYGYSVDILGQVRIWGIAQYIKSEYQNKNTQKSEESEQKEGQTNIDKNLQSEIDALKLKVEFLENKFEFLKKISSIRSTQ